MRIAVTGSIATDHLMRFRGRFAEQLLADRLATLSVSFLVDSLEIRRGGVAANVAFGMAQLGREALMVGAVGEDARDYVEDLQACGVDTSAVRFSVDQHTARFTCTTDADQNQIASFYPGAMDEAAEIDLGPLLDAGVDLVVVAPDNPDAMARHTAICRERGVPFSADPSQQLVYLDGVAIRNLVEGAQYLFTNDYELGLLTSKTGWKTADLLDHVQVRITTHGAQGSSVQARGEAEIRVGIVPSDAVVEPTGVGDAFRAGFLVARSWDLDLERSAQVGACLATLVVETTGTQEYVVEPATFLARFTAAYGAPAAQEIEPFLD